MELKYAILMIIVLLVSYLAYRFKTVLKEESERMFLEACREKFKKELYNKNEILRYLVVVSEMSDSKKEKEKAESYLKNVDDANSETLYEIREFILNFYDNLNFTECEIKKDIKI